MIKVSMLPSSPSMPCPPGAADAGVKIFRLNPAVKGGVHESASGAVSQALARETCIEVPHDEDAHIPCKALLLPGSAALVLVRADGSTLAVRELESGAANPPLSGSYRPSAEGAFGQIQ
eukprot:2876423-Rhodomonas_salina.1